MRESTLLTAGLVTLLACGGQPSGGTYELVVLTTGGGRVSAVPDAFPAPLHCGDPLGDQCRPTYEGGTVVELTATPEATSVFAGWGGACSGTSTCTVAIVDETVVTASFEPPETAWATLVSPGLYSRVGVVLAGPSVVVAAGITSSESGGASATSAAEVDAGPVDAGPIPVDGDLLFVAAYDSLGQEQWRVSATAVGDLTLAAASGESIFVGGWFSGHFSLGDVELDAVGPRAGILIELGAGGQVLDVMMVDGTGAEFLRGLVATGGELIVVGNFDGDLSIGDPLSSPGNRNVFLARRDTSDVWSATSFGSSGRDFALGATIDAAGDTLIAASFAGAATVGSLVGTEGVNLLRFDQLAVTAIDSVSDGQSEAGALSSLADGAVAIAGAFSGETTVDGQTLTSAGSTDWFVTKRMSDGTYAWIQQGGGVGDDLAYSMSAEGSRLYIGGSFAGTAGFGDALQMTVYGPGPCDVCKDGFVASLETSNGDLRWARRLGGFGTDSIRTVAGLSTGLLAGGEAHGAPVDVGTGPLVDGSGIVLAIEE